MKVLVVAAWEPELTRVRERLSSAPFVEHVVVAPIGVGLVDAAIGAARVLEAHAPTRAIFVGTCGRLFERARPMSRAPAVTEVVVGREACLVDAAILDGKAAVPGPMPTRLALDASLGDAAVDAGARAVRIANTIGVTIDDALAALLERHADVEHLEAFAFARAAAVHGVPCSAVLGVANVVGRGGRDEWREHHVQASSRAADVVMSVLERSFRTTTTAPSPARG